MYTCRLSSSSAVLLQWSTYKNKAADQSHDKAENVDKGNMRDKWHQSHAHAHYNKQVEEGKLPVGNIDMAT